MTTFNSVIPNLLVQNIDVSTAFYRDVLGFAVKQTVPDAAPFAFVWLERDGVPVFLNDAKAAAEDYPGETRPFGGSATLFFIVSDVEALHEKVAPAANVIMPLETRFYGMREFAVEDPDGHILTFAQRVTG